jgi:hypothetical protein
MAAQHCSTLFTPPLRILTLHKSSKRMLLDKGEIFDETRMVMLLIPCVKRLQVVARETAAFITKTNFILPKELAAFLKRTFLTLRTTSRAIGNIEPFPVDIIFARKVSAAHRTQFMPHGAISSVSSESVSSMVDLANILLS